MIRSVIKYCLHNRLLVVAVSIIIAVMGVWSLFRISIDAIPNLSDTQVIISSKWMGRDSQTIEDQVTYPLTTAMLAVPKVKDVRGLSFFGQSLVYIIFEDGTDIYWARSRIMEYLNQAQADLPKDVTPALGPDATGLGWVFLYTVEDTGNLHDLAELRALQDWYIRYQLLSVKGVAEVASVGGALRQYQIIVDPKKLFSYKLSLKNVISAIRKSNNDVGGEVMELGGAEFMIRGRGYIKRVKDIENVVLRSSTGGTPTLLRDVATVQIGQETKRGVAEKNGRGEVVAGIVVARHGANALDVINGVKEKIRSISQGLPKGVVIKPAYDRSGLINRAITTLKSKLIEEMAIVALVTLIFLWHARSALVASITLPLAVLASFIIMKSMGQTVNIMSLGGIAVAIGAMVDAAVVMVENAHKHLDWAKGKQERSLAVLNACMEVGPALFFSLLIITISFLPVFALQDQAGKLFKPLAFTKTFAMGAGAILAITLIPVLIDILIRGKIPSETKNPVSRVLITAYKPLIRFALTFRKSVIAIAVLLLLFTYIPYNKLGSEFMPPLKEGDILYMPTTVPGLPVAEATRILQVQDRLLKQFPEVNMVLGKIGRANTPTDPAPLSMVETHISLKPEKDWPARIVKTGYIKNMAQEMISLLKNKNLVTDFQAGDIPAQVERKSRWSINTWIREELLKKNSLATITRELPIKLLKTVSADLIFYLNASGHLTQSSAPKAETLLKSNKAKVPPLRKTTFEELTKEEMNRVISIPGMPNWWLMPIETRLGMLSTGMKGLLGLKIRGENLVELEKIALNVEQVLSSVSGTLSVSAERVMGGRYLDIDLDRTKLARYGITIEDAQAVIEFAIGGRNITRTVEGRYRFPVNIRYPQELRDDPEKIKKVLLTASNGAPIPLGAVSTISLQNGPAMIKSENGLLVTNVPVDIKAGLDIGTYVKHAQNAIDQAIETGGITLPPGYYMEWSGQFKFMRDVEQKLKLIIPVTLAIIFLLLYLNFGNLTDTLIIMLSLPFSVIGGVWFLYWLGYNLSVAVAVGFIALAGLAAETGIIMLTYLNLAYEKRKAEGLMQNRADLAEAIIDGAVMRVRPKIMVVSCLILGLLPIMWTEEAGSQAMQRMVAPMIGGLISATILTLIVIPVIYSFVKKRGA
ncbi:Cobalt-zinc-cadmium resistance protein CzcA; Cation efflux system protein CusA [hydrothermal vent metagenome]|uniref:Cobalt-zinc-cadmium resistance protein CzcA Cation efflux system protein CusA n=1 Tax=hydrothermal vent metagenome TaxID=652676 RepID=A0A3B1CEW9_9ZZZZ